MQPPDERDHGPSELEPVPPPPGLEPVPPRGASTSITAVAYKGRVEILVPPGVRVQVRGYSYGGRWADQVPDHDLPADAPVVHVRAVVYKGVVETRPTPAPDREITRG